MYILYLEFKTTIENEEFHFLIKIFYLNKVYDCFSLSRYMEENKFFNPVID